MQRSDLKRAMGPTHVTGCNLDSLPTVLHGGSRGDHAENPTPIELAQRARDLARYLTQLADTLSTRAQ